MTTAATRARVIEVLEPVVRAAGYDVEDVVVTPAGKRRLLRLVIDRDGGVSLDDVAEISRAVSEALDAEDAMGGGAYVLEVTSPGVDRPLTAPRHWRRATGRLVRATLRGGGEVVGRVVDSDDATATLDVDSARRTLDLTDVATAAVQVEFARPGGEDDGADGVDEGVDRGEPDEYVADENDDEDEEEPPA